MKVGWRWFYQNYKGKATRPCLCSRNPKWAKSEVWTVAVPQCATVSHSVAQCGTVWPSLDCGSQNETGLSGNLGFLTSTVQPNLTYLSYVSKCSLDSPLLHQGAKTSNFPLMQQKKNVRPVQGPCACRRGCIRTC